jgi:hypothetical protein
LIQSTGLFLLVPQVQISATSLRRQV